MGHQDAAAGGVGGAAAQHTAQRVAVRFDGLVRVHVAHHGGLQEGKQIDVHGAEVVGQGDGRGDPIEHRADVDPAPGQQVRAERDPLGGIVVAADGEHRQPPGRKRGEEPVQQPDGLGRGNGLVVQVARQQHSVHGAGVEEGEDLL